MNWKKLVTELNSVMTLQDIADHAGMASKGHVHDLREGHTMPLVCDWWSCGDRRTR
jgi:hypothetical protein